MIVCDRNHEVRRLRYASQGPWEGNTWGLTMNWGGCVKENFSHGQGCVLQGPRNEYTTVVTWNNQKNPTFSFICHKTRKKKTRKLWYLMHHWVPEIGIWGHVLYIIQRAVLRFCVIWNMRVLCSSFNYGRDVARECLRNMTGLQWMTMKYGRW